MLDSADIGSPAETDFLSDFEQATARDLTAPVVRPRVHAEIERLLDERESAASALRSAEEALAAVSSYCDTVAAQATTNAAALRALDSQLLALRESGSPEQVASLTQRRSQYEQAVRDAESERLAAVGLLEGHAEELEQQRIAFAHELTSIGETLDLLHEALHNEYVEVEGALAALDAQFLAEHGVSLTDVLSRATALSDQLAHTRQEQEAWSAQLREEMAVLSQHLDELEDRKGDLQAQLDDLTGAGPTLASLESGQPQQYQALQALVEKAREASKALQLLESQRDQQLHTLDQELADVGAAESAILVRRRDLMDELGPLEQDLGPAGARRPLMLRKTSERGRKFTRMAALSSELQELDRRTAELVAQRRRVEQALEELHESMAGALTVARARASAAEATRDSAQQDFLEVEARIEALRATESSGAATPEVADLRRQLHTLTLEIAETASRRDSVTVEFTGRIEAARTREGALSAELAEVEASLAESGDALAAARASHAHLTAQLRSLEQGLSVTAAERQAVAAEVAEAEIRIRESGQKMATLRSQVAEPTPPETPGTSSPAVPELEQPSHSIEPPQSSAGTGSVDLDAAIAFATSRDLRSEPVTLAVDESPTASDDSAEAELDEVPTDAASADSDTAVPPSDPALLAGYRDLTLEVAEIDAAYQSMLAERDRVRSLWAQTREELDGSTRKLGDAQRALSAMRTELGNVLAESTRVESELSVEQASLRSLQSRLHTVVEQARHTDEQIVAVESRRGESEERLADATVRMTQAAAAADEAAEALAVREREVAQALAAQAAHEARLAELAEANKTLAAQAQEVVFAQRAELERQVETRRQEAAKETAELEALLAEVEAQAERVEQQKSAARSRLAALGAASAADEDRAARLERIRQQAAQAREDARRALEAARQSS